MTAPDPLAAIKYAHRRLQVWNLLDRVDTADVEMSIEAALHEAVHWRLLGNVVSFDDPPGGWAITVAVLMSGYDGHSPDDEPVH